MEKPTLTDIKGIGSAAAERLTKAGYATISDVAGAEAAKLSTVSGFSDERAQSTIAAAKELTGSDDIIDASPEVVETSEATPTHPNPAKSEVIDMTTDKTETTATTPDTAAAAAPATEKTEAAPVKAEAPKVEAKKAAPTKAKPKAAAKKPAAKKTSSKPAATAKAAPKAAPKSEPKAATPKAKPAAAATAAAAAATKPTAPAITSKRSIFKEPGYLAAGVVLILAAYGFAQQPGVQSFFGYESADSVSTSTAALTAPSTSTPGVAKSSTPPASTAPNMPTNMSTHMQGGMMPGYGGNPALQNRQVFPPAPYGAQPYGAPAGAPTGMMGTPGNGVPSAQNGAQGNPQVANKAAPMPPFGPYSHPGYNEYGNSYGQGYGNGYGNGYGQGNGGGDFNMNFATRAQTQANTSAYGNGGGYNGWNGYNGYNAYNGPAPYGYGPAPYPMPHATMQPAAPTRPLSQ